MSKQAVSNWENNNILPSIDMLVRISRFFSVSTDYLLELDNRHYLEVGGLTMEQLSHIQFIINDLRKVKTTGLAGGLFCPYKGLLPACARKAH